MSLFGFILTFSYKPTVSEPCTSMFFNPVHWDLPCMFKAMFRQQANPTQRHDHSSHSQVTKHSLSQCDSTDWCSHTALLAAAWTLLSHSVAHSISLDSALCVSLPVTQKKTLWDPIWASRLRHTGRNLIWIPLETTFKVAWIKFEKEKKTKVNLDTLKNCRWHTCCLCWLYAFF